MRKIYTCILTAILCSVVSILSVCGQVSNWTAAGPIAFPVNLISQINGMGRVSQLKFDPVNRARVYAVAPHAVFVSNDSTNTWSALPGTDVFPTSMNFASVCIDYSNNHILYLGTGDANYYSTGAANASGVWKSTDGGNTFVRSSTGLGNLLVSEIIMSPADHNTLVAATSNGIWKTIDGGNTWLQVQAGGKFTDMRLNAATGSTTLYATTNTDAAFYRSTDFGTTWAATNLAGTLKSYGGRVAVTPADTAVVYVAFIGNNDTAGGIIYRSADGGQTFALKKGNTAPNITGYSTTSSGQGNYNFAIGGDPNNANMLYLVSHMIYKSTNGGATWAQTYSTNWAGTIHTDMHGIVFNPWNSTQLYNINDGGVWLNTDGMAKTWTPKCQGLVSSEFYHMANSHINGGVIGGGLQDNAEVFLKNGVWYCNRGGDFTATYYTDYTTNKMYYLSSGARRDVYNSPTGSSQSLGLPTAFTPSTSDVMAFSNTNNNVAFWSPNPLTSAQNSNYQSLDGFYVTTNLANNPPTWTWTQFNGSKAFSMAAAYGTDSLFIIYANGSFTRVANASGLGGTRSIVNTANTFVSATLGVASFSAGAVTALKNGKIYLAANGSVFRSKDNGNSWTAVGTGAVTTVLQSQKVKKLIADTSHTGIEAVYAYTSQGVYYKDTTMTDWSFFTTSLPGTASLTDMDIYYDQAYAGNSTLRVSSYGRGTWQSSLVNNPPPQTPPTVSIMSPANNAGYAPGADITITTDAVSPNTTGSITKVDFYQGSTLLGTVTTAPYNFTWSNVPLGFYTITAKATDNVGITVTSTAVNIFVGSCTSPVLIPQSQLRVMYYDSQNSTSEAASNVLDGNTATIWHTQYSPAVAPLPHEIQLSLNGVYNVNTFQYLPRSGAGNGTVGNYEVYVSMDSTNWGTPVATGTFASNATLKVVNFAEKQGRYVRFRALSEINGQQFTSAAEINVGGCQLVAPPTVAVTSPANNAAYTTGANITITANAASAGGSIAKVDFYQGNIKLGTVTSAPYNFTWNGVAGGIYSITATATDNYGFATASAAVNITVGVTSFVPTADAYVRDGSYANTNFGTDSSLVVKNDGSSYFRETYLLFDYNLLTDTAAVNTKLLRVYASGVNTDPTRVVSLYGIANTGWGETTITYNNQPAEAGSFIGKDTITNAGGRWYTWDITAYINSQLTAGNKLVSFRLINQGTVSGTGDVTFKSREASGNNPQLLFIQKQAQPPIVSITTPVDNANFNAGSNIVISATASSLNANGSIADVKFYKGNSLLATVTTAPYRFTWNNVLPGMDTLTAVATDNVGLADTSAVVIIKVNDIMAPVIQTPTGSLDTVLQCSDAAGLIVALGKQPNATDDYTPNPVIHLVADSTMAQCGSTFTRVRSWNFTDSTGNASNTFIQTIVVRDTTAPVIAGKADTTVSANEGGCTYTVSGNEFDVTATDDCNTVSSLGYTLSGATTGAGNTTLLGAVLNNGITTVTWTATDACGNQLNSSFAITVSDTEKPVVKTKPVTITLVNGMATITPAAINDGSTDNCGIASIGISRSTFNCSNMGNNIVTLTVTDIHGNTATATAVVTVAGQIPAVTIAAVPSDNTFTGGNPANMYLGYGSQSVTLQATAVGGAPYTYAWNGNGALSNVSVAAPVFAPTQAGLYGFTVQATNANGCASTASISICVRDIRVPSSNGKVYIAHVPSGNTANAKTIAIDVAAVTSHLANHAGDHLGAVDMPSCSGNVAATATGQQQTRVAGDESMGVPELNVKVSPNPSATLFRLEVLGDSKEKVQTIITDANGRILKQMVTVPGELIRFGEDLKAGTYFAEVQQGRSRKVIKVIKL